MIPSGYVGAMNQPVARRAISPVVVLVAACWLTPATARAQASAPRGVFRLTTDLRGPAACLDIINGGPSNLSAALRPCGNLSGQGWIATPTGGGYVALTTEFRGLGMCLDVFNGGPRNNQVELRPCRSASGQRWRFQPLADGKVRLTGELRGSRVCLDVVNGGEQDGQAELRPCSHVSGQLWTLTPFVP